MTATSDVLLADGTIAVIRPLMGGDRGALEALHAEVSDTSSRLRFFAAGRKAGRDYVAHLFSDAPAEITLLALVEGAVVAVATAERLDAGTAEVAFLVRDDLRGHGVGSLLLEHLAAAGRDRGISRFTADVLGENVAMAGVFRSAGFDVVRRTEQGVIEVEMSTAASALAVAAADRREGRAEARSLGALAHPRRVAVIGAAGGGATTVGDAVLASVVDGGFTGDLVVVHPTAGSVAGVPAHPRLVDVPGRVDLAVVAVPAAELLAVLGDAVLAAVPTVVVLSGLDEAGPDDAERRLALVRLARAHSIRLIGPHSLGVLVNDPGTRLNATLSALVPRPGGLALASQSGGVGVSLLEAASRTRAGVLTLVSLGDKVDVSGNDLLAAWLEDPRVTAAGLYLESFGNAPKLARLARRFAERKPLLVVVGGLTADGRRAGSSHSGATAAPVGAVTALLRQAGVIECRSVEELAETALVLAEQPLPAGLRTAVITDAGGLGVLAADAAGTVGLVVPVLSPGLRTRLAELTAPPTGSANPVDLGPGTGRRRPP